jgi:sodium/bile acid cotransporter 7
MTNSNENSPETVESATEQGESTAVPKNSATTNNDTEHEVDEDKEPVSKCKQIWNAWWKFYSNNDFIIQVVIAILLARAYPPLGAEYLQPEITSTWICVLYIFVLAGLGLKTEEFKKAFQRFRFNVAVQAFNFGVVSSLVFGVSRGLVLLNAIPQSLADGMVVCASLPVSINVCLVLTKSAGGDEASAIFNAAFGNMIGVFLSPMLILGYLGVSGDVALWDVFYKLALRVVLPVSFGQILQKFSPAVVAFAKEHKKRFTKAQQLALVFIVYTVFCQTFSSEDENVAVADIFIMIAIQFFLLCLVMSLSWVFLKLLFANEPTLRVMGLFGCTHKTVAMGVPLINAIYENDTNVGLYTLPLLIWFPMQLVLGSFLAPKLLKWVEAEKARLGEEGEDDNGGVLKEEQQEETTKNEAPETSVIENDYEESAEC